MLYDYFSMTPFLRLSKITDILSGKSSPFYEHQVYNYTPDVHKKVTKVTAKLYFFR